MTCCSRVRSQFALSFALHLHKLLTFDLQITDMYITSHTKFELSFVLSLLCQQPFCMWALCGMITLILTFWSTKALPFCTSMKNIFAKSELSNNKTFHSWARSLYRTVWPQCLLTDSHTCTTNLQQLEIQTYKTWPVLLQCKQTDADNLCFSEKLSFTDWVNIVGKDNMYDGYIQLQCNNAQSNVITNAMQN